MGMVEEGGIIGKKDVVGLSLIQDARRRLSDFRYTLLQLDESVEHRQVEVSLEHRIQTPVILPELVVSCI